VFDIPWFWKYRRAAAGAAGDLRRSQESANRQIDLSRLRERLRERDVHRYAAAIRRGVKIIEYHGWNDQTLQPEYSPTYLIDLGYLRGAR
jgi:hypothetical protein